MSKYSYEVFRGQLIGAGLNTVLLALAIAKDAHEGQFRADKVTPYIEHPVKVAELLYDLGIRDQVILSAALLHDTLEDTKVQPIDLLAKFYTVTADHNIAYNIGFIVELVTKPDDYNPAEYFEGIKNNIGATLIKLADRCHNLSTLYLKPNIIKKYIKETKDYYYPLIAYAQNHYYEYSNVLRVFDLWITSLINTLEIKFEPVYENYIKQLDESEKELFKAEIDQDVSKILDEKE